MESSILYSVIMAVPVLSILVNRPDVNSEFVYACLLSSFMGFLLRIAKRFNESGISFKSLAVQSVFSICVCYFAFLLLLDYNIRDMVSYIILGASSFLAAEIVSAFELYGNKGIRSFIRGAIKKWVSSAEEDDIKQEKDNDNKS